jgi:hypothetical protein
MKNLNHKEYNRQRNNFLGKGMNGSALIWVFDYIPPGSSLVDQGILTEGEGSVQFISFNQPV